MRGSVKWFHEKRGFGYIAHSATSDEYFFHYSELQKEGFKTTEEGEEFYFQLGQKKGRRLATNLVPISHERKQKKPIHMPDIPKKYIHKDDPIFDIPERRPPYIPPEKNSILVIAVEDKKIKSPRSRSPSVVTIHNGRNTYGFVDKGWASPPTPSSSSSNYSSRSRSRSKSRHQRNDYIIERPYGLCPFCGQRSSSLRNTHN